MKRIISALLFISMIFLLTGCNNKTEKEEPNPIAGKIYMYDYNPSREKLFDFSFVKFYDDNTFHGVATKSFTKLPNGKSQATHDHYYGTYEISENAITLNLSDKSYVGVIVDNGASLKFGTDELTDWTDTISDEDPLLSQFE